MWYESDWYGWGAHFFSWWGLIITFLFVAAVVLAVLKTNGDSRARQPLEESPTPLDILARRYAAGEIDRDEYKQKREDLSA